MTGARRAFVFGVAAFLAAAGPEQPQTMLAQIHARGARAVVNQLAAGDGTGWDQVLGQIEAGTPAWLDVGLALKAGTDAGTGEGLSTAMATALLSNPEEVLRRVAPVFGERTICAVPLIEPSAGEVASYRSKARSALAQVKAPDLLPAARRCSAEVGS